MHRPASARHVVPRGRAIYLSGAPTLRYALGMTLLVCHQADLAVIAGLAIALTVALVAR